MNRTPGGRSLVSRPLHRRTVSPTGVRSRTLLLLLRPRRAMSSTFISTTEVSSTYSGVSLPAHRAVPCLLDRPPISVITSDMVNVAPLFSIPQYTAGCGCASGTGRVNEPQHLRDTGELLARLALGGTAFHLRTVDYLPVGVIHHA